MTPPSGYFSNSVAVVTGGAAGIGLALGEAMLLRDAAAVILFDRNKEELASQVRRLDRTSPGRVFGLSGDVTIEADIAEMIAAVAERHGRLDFLFNNAGAGLGGLFVKQSNEDWEHAFALNFYGPLYGMRAALPIMQRQRSGHVVNIVSGIAFAPMAQQTMYSATKAALNALTLALRYEHWDDGVRFTSATPGTTATQIWGPRGAPSHAQSAADAAEKILDGVADNQRLVLGDEGDVRGATDAFNPAAAGAMDHYLLDVARRRRSGEVVV